MQEIYLEPEIQDYCPSAYEALRDALGHHSIHLYRLRKKLKKRRQQFLKYPVLSEKEAKRADLLVVWSPYATSHRAKEWSQKFKVPLLHLEGGFLPNSALCDIKGFWGEASICQNIGSILDPFMGEKDQQWADSYSRFLMDNNLSKRSQPKDATDPGQEFAFLPMQYMDDQSVLRYGNMPYPKFVKKVAAFCRDNNVVLAVKKHPHAYRKEPKNVDSLLSSMKKRHGKFFLVVDGSIHWFCQNCLFMAGMNTGSIADGLVNKTITSHCGQSIFMKSGAVIHDDDVARGLGKCLSLTDVEKEVIRKRQNAMLYFLYNRYLLLASDSYGSEMTNEQKIRKQVEAVL